MSEDWKIKLKDIYYDVRDKLEDMVITNPFTTIGIIFALVFIILVS